MHVKDVPELGKRDGEEGDCRCLLRLKTEPLGRDDERDQCAHCQSERNIGSDAFLMMTLTISTYQSRLKQVDFTAAVHLSFHKL